MTQAQTGKWGTVSTVMQLNICLSPFTGSTSKMYSHLWGSTVCWFHCSWPFRTNHSQYHVVCTSLLNSGLETTFVKPFWLSCLFSPLHESLFSALQHTQPSFSHCFKDTWYRLKAAISSNQMETAEDWATTHQASPVPSVWHDDRHRSNMWMRIRKSRGFLARLKFKLHLHHLATTWPKASHEISRAQTCLL